jgi:K+-sensing histidine kinase KdpD
MKDSSKILIGMSHEMRSYMNSIVCYSFLSEKASNPEESDMQYSSKILNSCNQLLWLFENFLDSAMMDAGNPEVNPENCRLASILQNLIPELREIIDQEDKKGIMLIDENNYSDLTEVYIDSARVKRAIHTLFHNAANNMNSGYIKIGYYFMEGKVTFYILDSGQDYSKPEEFLYTEDMDKSLTKFFDAGYAINISLAKKLIQLLGGTISIKRHDLTGTGVYLSVPVKVKERASVTSNGIESAVSSRLNVLNY